MSLRTVAGETPRWCRSTRAFEPTGSLVDTKSWTMARSTSSLRSSSIRSPPSDAAWRASSQQAGTPPLGVPVYGARRPGIERTRPRVYAVDDCVSAHDQGGMPGGRRARRFRASALPPIAAPGLPADGQPAGSRGPRARSVGTVLRGVAEAPDHRAGRLRASGDGQRLDQSIATATVPRVVDRH